MLFRGLLHIQDLILGYAVGCKTLRVAGITTRSVVQLNLPTLVFRLDDALEAYTIRCKFAGNSPYSVLNSRRRSFACLDRVWPS